MVLGCYETFHGPQRVLIGPVKNRCQFAIARQRGHLLASCAKTIENLASLKNLLPLVAAYDYLRHACQGLHALADRSRTASRKRWADLSLVERIGRVCGTQVRVEDQRLTLVR